MFVSSSHPKVIAFNAEGSDNAYSCTYTNGVYKIKPSQQLEGISYVVVIAPQVIKNIEGHDS